MGSKQGFNAVRGCHSVFVGSQDNVWMVTTDDFLLCKFDGFTFTYYGKDEGFHHTKGGRFYEEEDGTLWISSNEEGICRFDGHSFEYISTDQGLSHNRILGITKDKSGGFWFASEGGGLNHYEPTSFHHLTALDQFQDINWTIIQDRQNNLWYGSQNGLTRDNGKTLTYFNKENGLPDFFMRSSALDTSNLVWFGMRNGLMSIDGNEVDYYNLDGRYPGNIIKGMCMDDQNRLWLSTNKGIGLKDGDEFYQLTLDEGLPTQNFYGIIQSSDGDMWIGSNLGLINYSEDMMTLYSVNEGLSGSWALCLLEDKEGNIWCGTFGEGLNMWDGESFRHFTTEDGLSNNTCWAVREDDYGRIWVTTEKGVTLVEKKDGDYRLTALSKKDGLRGEDFYTNSAWIDNGSNLLLGSGKGLTTINLNHFRSDTTSPEAFLYTVDVNQQFINFHMLEDSAYLVDNDTLKSFKNLINPNKAFQNHPEELELEYDQNHLTFHFGAIDWNAPHKIQYSYMMEGLENTWSSPTDETKADYRSMSPGQYSFKLKAIGESGNWSDQISFDFQIKPPWWLTTFAKVVYGFLIILILYILYRLRTAQLKKRQKELEIIVDDRTREVVQQKEEIAEQHQEITDSIHYAKRLQNAILPKFEDIEAALPQHFILFKPKDVVSGDFYWFEKKNDLIFIASADCTGHGVPGAMVSVVCSNALNRSVNEFNLSAPNEILNKTRELVIETFSKSGEDVKDGMDIALCVIDKASKKIIFSGANNPLWVIRKKSLLNKEELNHKSTVTQDDYALYEIKADKQPVGLYAGMKSFSSVEIDLLEDDRFYLFTDGYADQFGGEDGKKLKYKPFKRILLQHFLKPMADQGPELNSIIDDWMKNYEQVDDICVIGIKV